MDDDYYEQDQADEAAYYADCAGRAQAAADSDYAEAMAREAQAQEEIAEQRKLIQAELESMNTSLEEECERLREQNDLLKSLLAGHTSTNQSAIDIFLARQNRLKAAERACQAAYSFIKSTAMEIPEEEFSMEKMNENLTVLKDLLRAWDIAVEVAP